jgi:CRP-like cAMP-binding protein
MTTSTDSPNGLISGRVSILEEDDGLAQAIPAEDLGAARRHLRAPQIALEPGSYMPDELFPGERLLGLLIVDGLLIREVLVADRQCGELVGPGSLLRPWDHFGDHTPMPFDVRWRVLEPTRMAVLSRDLLSAAAHWPGVMETLVERGISRAQTLAFTVAIHCLHHVELRIVVLLWHLADRFGRMTPDGVLIPLPLTHRDLAELVGAQRPSVSTALSELARQGTVTRRSDRAWLLAGEPPQELRDLRGRGEHNGGQA